MSEASIPIRVPVGTVVRFAYRSVFGRLGLVLEIGWAPLLVLLAATIVPSLVFPARATASLLDVGPSDIGQAIVVLLALTAFAVRWHQLLLIGDPRRLPPAAFFRGWLRFLAYIAAAYIAIGIVIGVAVTVAAKLVVGDAALALAELAAIVIAILLALAIVRCGLIFPAAACAAPLGVAAAWRLMRGNAWRLALASTLAAVPVMVVTAIATALIVAISLPSAAEETVTSPLSLVLLAGLLETGADVCLVALGASLLSAFYRELVGPGAAAPSQR